MSCAPFWTLTACVAASPSTAELPRLPPLSCSELCSFLEIDGVRGDITINKACRAFVAFEGRTQATEADLERIAPLVLNHR